MQPAGGGTATATRALELQEAEAFLASRYSKVWK
jgi:hypothetical protein